MIFIKLVFNVPYFSRFRIYFPTVCALVILASPVPADDGLRANEFYEDAVGHFNQHQFEEALIQLKNALKLDSKHLAAHVLLGRTFLKQHKYAAAEQILRKANGLGADRSLTSLPLARAYLALQKAERLIKEITPNQFKSPLKAQIFAVRGKAQLMLGQRKNAEISFENAIGLAPDNAQAMLGKAIILIAKGETRKAENLVEQAISARPNDPDVWLIIAAISHEHGFLSQALKEYDEVIRLDPLNREALTSRAGILIDLNRNQEAVAELRRFSNNFPYDPRVHYLYALALFRMDHPDQALEALRKAEQILSAVDRKGLISNRQALLLAAMVNYSLKNLESATDLLEQYIRLDPRHIGARKLLGNIYLVKNRYKKGIQILSPLTEALPNDEWLFATLGTLHMRDGSHLQASLFLEKALRLNSANSNVKANLAITQFAGGKEQLAIDQLISISRDDPGFAYANTIIAAIHINNGDYKKAIEAGQNLIAADGKNLTALNLLGLAQVHEHKRKAARKTFENALNIDSEFTPARLNLARLDMLEKHTGAAREHLERILGANINHAEAMVEMSKLELIQDRPDRALKWLEKAYEIKPRSARIVRKLANAYLQNGSIDKALKIANEAIRWAPHDFDIGLSRSHILAASGDTESAKNSLKKMATETSMPRQLFMIARLQARIGETIEAIWNLEKVISKEPGAFRARLQLIELLIESRRWEPAEKQIGEFQKRHPKSAASHRLLGDLAFERSQNKKAIAHFKKALEKSGTSGLVHRIARAYQAAGLLEEKTNFLQEWLQSNPKDSQTRVLLAETYIQTEDLDQAIKTYKELLEDQPKDPVLLNNLAIIYGKKDDPKALTIAQKAYEIAPENPSINDTFGWLLVQHGDVNKGLKLLRNAFARVSSDPEIRFHLAVAHQKLGRLREAKTHLKAALSSGHHFDGLETARDLFNGL